MANSYPTPHIQATPDDFAETVLMPGDPLRSEWIAKTYLSSARLVNNVRGVQGYTGYFEGAPISVMASGMGMPSMGIYSYELFHFFGVENIIRVGSAGSLQPHVQLRDIVLGMGACTNSSYAAQYDLPGTFAPLADFTLLQTAVNTAREQKLPFHVGNLLSSDTFYTDESHRSHSQKAQVRWGGMGVLAVEMEAAALYMNAAQSGKRALAVCTVSDHLLTGEATTAEQRQNSFTDMIELALHTAKKLG